MTMFRRISGGYGGGYAEGFGVMSQLHEGYDFNYNYNYNINNSCSIEPACNIGSDQVVGTEEPILMAEDESRTTESLHEGGGGGGAESSSKEARDENKHDDQGWLQLSIGSHSHETKPDDDENSLRKDGPGLVELDLLPSTSSNNNNNNNNNSCSHLQMMRPLAPMAEFRAPRQVVNFHSGFSPSFFFPQYPGGSSSSNFHPHQQQEINWAFRPQFVPINIATVGSSSSSPSSPSSLMAPGSYFSRPPFQLFAGVDMAAGPSLDFRVIPPPRRPHSGIWFMLQASQNQEREPFLPQISKSYLRIKDGGMTIRLVIKYLVNKLRLEDESEVEIRCKGQRLPPFLTVQHVRDNIWISSPRDNNFITLLPNSSTTQHIMVLHYARSTNASSN